MFSCGSILICSRFITLGEGVVECSGRKLLLANPKDRRSVYSGWTGRIKWDLGLGLGHKIKSFFLGWGFFSDLSFGHLGYPGTSIWIDPVSKGIVIFLTNRVHPSRLDERIKRFRPLIHNLVVKFWEQHGN